MGSYDVETVSVDGATTALGSAGPFTLVVDRPTAAGGGGKGFSGGQLLNLAVAGCISNDLFREASKRGISLSRVAVRVTSDYPAEGAPSTPIGYEVELSGDAPTADLERLLADVDGLAEIPKSLRQGTPVTLVGSSIRGTD